MNKTNKLSALLLLIIIAMTSCTGSDVAYRFKVEKRHYRPGWHIDIDQVGVAGINPTEARESQEEVPVLSAPHKALEQEQPVQTAANTEALVEKGSEVGMAPKPLPGEGSEGKTLEKKLPPEPGQGSSLINLAGKTIATFSHPLMPEKIAEELESDDVTAYELCLYSGVLALVFAFLTRSTAWDTALTGWILSIIFVLIAIGAGLWGFVKLFDKGTLKDFLYIIGGLALACLTLLVLYWFLWF